MNFDFSPEQHALRDTARRLFAERVGFDALRRRHEQGDACLLDAELWRTMADLGWLGAAIPTQYGGAGQGAVELCVLAEEIGHCLAPVPFVLSSGLVAEAIRCHGTEAQRQHYLPALSSGERIGTFALVEGPGKTDISRIKTTYSPSTGLLNGVKLPVPAVPEANLALVVCQADQTGSPPTLALVDLRQAAVRAMPLQRFDPFRTQARLEFCDAAAEPLGGSMPGPAVLDALFDRAAVLTAFEQIGGASACLEMAREWALQRRVFARPIGSFQAIKHRLADMAVKIELARSNAWFAAWALEQVDAGLAEAIPGGFPLAAATARIAASEAFDFASRENLQIHGGIGFTWDANCHPYYTRARHLAVLLGGEPVWTQRLISALGENTC